jgi:hypothetical protein
MSTARSFYSLVYSFKRTPLYFVNCHFNSNSSGRPLHSLACTGCCVLSLIQSPFDKLANYYVLMEHCYVVMTLLLYPKPTGRQRPTSGSSQWWLLFIIIIGSTVLLRTLAASHRRFRNLIKTQVGLLWTSDQPVAKASTYTGQHNTGTQEQTSMPPAVFKPTIPVTKQPRPAP